MQYIFRKEKGRGFYKVKLNIEKEFQKQLSMINIRYTDKKKKIIEMSVKKRGKIKISI